MESVQAVNCQLFILGASLLGICWGRRTTVWRQELRVEGEGVGSLKFKVPVILRRRIYECVSGAKPWQLVPHKPHKGRPSNECNEKRKKTCTAANFVSSIDAPCSC